MRRAGAGFRAAPAVLDNRAGRFLRVQAVGLDAATRKLHLTGNGSARVVQGSLSPQGSKRAASMRPGADAETVRMGWIESTDQLESPLMQGMAQAARDAATADDEQRKNALDTDNDKNGATAGGLR
jgi:hypothetical protein